jgi:membrane protein implicated in regulation of membrane protease activity
VDGLFVVTGGLVCSLLLWFWLNRYLPRLPYFNRLILSTVAGGSAAGAATAEGGAIGGKNASGSAVGDSGEALTDLRPGGSARLQPTGDVLPVVSDSGFVKAGSRLVVREVSGNRIVVRAVT